MREYFLFFREIKKHLHRLKRRGLDIQLIVTFPNAPGLYSLSPLEAMKYIQNPDKFAAERFNITFSQWHEWKNYTPYSCRGTTRKGMPCKAYAPFNGSVVDFTQHNTGYCYVHSIIHNVQERG